MSKGKFYHSTYFSYSLLLLLFLISVLIRKEGIYDEKYPVIDQHVLMLTTFEVWDQEGMAEHHFSPVQTFTNAGDKYITYYHRLESNAGNNYYISYPPFAFIFFYAIFELLSLANSSYYLFWIAIISHAISAFFLYKLIRIIVRSAKPTTKTVLPILAVAIYLFLPANLHIYLQVPFPEMLGQVFLMIILWYILFLISRESASNISLWILGVFSFFAAYTAWYAYALVLAIVIVVVWQLIQRNITLKIYYIYRSVIYGTLAGGVLTLFQYSSIAGIYPFFRHLSLRMVVRSGYFSEKYSEEGINIYSSNLYEAFLENVWHTLYLFPLLLLLLFIIKMRFDKQSYVISDEYKIFLALTVLPSVIYFLFTLNSSILHRHTYSILSIPIVLLIIYLLFKLEFQKRIFAVASIVTGVVVVFSGIYFYRNYKLKVNDPYLTEVAQKIRSEASPEEAIFININSENKAPLVFLTYFTRRNMTHASSAEIAHERLLELNKEKGIFFNFNQRNKEYSILKISAQ